MNRPCLEPRCPNYATYRGRCYLHSKERDRHIDRKGKATYNSKRWAMLRKHKLSLNPICERCNNQVATDVHHVHGVEAGPWNLDDLEALCHGCHSRETRRLQLTGEGRVASRG